MSGVHTIARRMAGVLNDAEANGVGITRGMDGEAEWYELDDGNVKIVVGLIKGSWVVFD